MDKRTAVACKDFITSVAHQTDVITRSSVANIQRFGSVISSIEKGGTQLSREECHKLEARAIEAHRDEPNKDLYIPGQVCYLYHDGSQERVYSAIVKDGTLDVLKMVHLSPTMIEDHLKGN